MTQKILQPEPTQLAQSNASEGVAAFKRRTPQSTLDSAYQSYLFGSAGSDENPAWSDSAKGRAAIRLISRGIVGAAFFAIGGRLANNHLNGYNQNTRWADIDHSKPLQYIAKGIDMTLGRAIQKTVTSIAGLKHGPQAAAQIGRKAVKFRSSREHMGSGYEKGRSYGADIVGFTFDFAMASIGDAGTRSIIQAFDPNVKKTWRVNDEGKPAVKGETWHFLPGEWLKSTAKTTWRVMTKNQGEDWAAAIPYAFQMKFQRQFLSNIFNKRWEGHKLQFDRSWNGGAYRINPEGHIVGDMQLAGAIDLHARFVGYNWYTLMFREGYDSIGNALSNWKKNDYKIDFKLPEHFNPLTAPIDAAAHAARYVTKSFIKANMYMNPAVIPFWLIRVPQSKWHGRNYIEGSPARLGADTNIWKEQHQLRPGETILKPFDAKNYEHYPSTTKLDKFEKAFSRALNPIGLVSFKTGNKAADFSDYVVSKTGETNAPWLKNILQYKGRLPEGRRRFMHEFTDASFAYTPYMWAKAETALRVDDNKGDGKLGQMDVAIYKFMDDVASFKFKSVPDDIKKMWKLGTNFERPVKAREGAEPDAQVIVQAPLTPSRPTTLVHASSIEQAAGATMRRAPSANDADYHTDRRWAQMVAGSDINAARFHPASPTRH